MKEYDQLVERQREATLNVFSTLNEKQREKLAKMIGGGTGRIA